MYILHSVYIDLDFGFPSSTDDARGRIDNENGQEEIHTPPKHLIIPSLDQIFCAYRFTLTIGLFTVCSRQVLGNRGPD
jgi:hypothetical protein